MNNGGRQEGAGPAHGEDVWGVMVILPVVGALLLLVLVCWLLYSCAKARQTTSKAGPLSRQWKRQRQRQLSADEERKLVEAGRVRGRRASVVDLGDAMVCKPPPSPLPEPHYENLFQVSHQDVAHSEYANVHNFPPWVHLVLSQIQRRLLGRQPEVRRLAVPGTQPRSGWPTDGTQVFRAELAATSTPLSSGDSSPGSEVLQRAPRESRNPAGLSSRTCHLLFRDNSQHESTWPHHDWEHGAAGHPPRVGNHYITSHWGQKDNKASAEEPVYEQVHAVPTGKVTPVRRPFQPHVQPAPAPLPQAPHREGGIPGSFADPQSELLGVKQQEGAIADVGGEDSIQLHQLKVNKESAGAVAQMVLHQRVQSCATISTSSSTSSNTVRKPPIPRPRTSVATTQRQTQGTHSTSTGVLQVVHVHRTANARSLARSTGSTLSARRQSE